MAEVYCLSKTTHKILNAIVQRYFIIVYNILCIDANRFRLVKHCFDVAYKFETFSLCDDGDCSNIEIRIFRKRCHFLYYSFTKSTAQRWVASHPFGQVLLRVVKKEERRGRCSLLHDTEFRSKIDQAINDNPFHSATDLIDFFKKETTMDVNVSSNTMSTWRRRLNYTKKNHEYSFIENDKVRDKRTMFSQQLEANDMNSRELLPI